MIEQIQQIVLAVWRSGGWVIPAVALGLFLLDKLNRYGAERLVGKLNRELGADKDGMITLDNTLAGRFTLEYPKHGWLTLTAVRIVFTIRPHNPKRPFAVRMRKRRSANLANLFLPVARYAYAELEQCHHPTQERHLFWALMKPENRNFWLTHRVEIHKHHATWHVEEAHPFFLLHMVALRPRFQKKLAACRQLLHQALDPNPILPLAELLAYDKDVRIRRRALFQWVTAKPYHATLHQRILAPRADDHAESIMLWLYCGGPSQEDLWQTITKPNHPHDVALFTAWLENLPKQRRVSFGLKALEIPHLARNASCVLMQTQDPLIVPHFIARFCEDRKRLALLTGLCLPEDARALSFLRELLQHGDEEVRVQAAYELAKCGTEEDLRIMAEIKNTGGYRLKKLLETPVLRMRARLGLDGATAGFLTAATVAHELGALSTPEYPDLAIASMHREPSPTLFEE